MLLWTPLTGTQLSPVAPRSLSLPSGHTTGNRHDWRAKPDNPRSNRPERRTALVTRELARYKVDIAALSETRSSEPGQLEEMGSGYTFFWSGRPKSERRDAHLQTYLVLIGTTHASAWLVTCESIAQRLANQCKEHQNTPTAPKSTVHTAQAHSHTSWAY
ncbi:unnamed protein product [Schistocephalus solidus]|uniref:Uncharacterized protein n=1 Tax=Schistocephalus solidus TaxID=70667 RepID=A0A183SNU7_SCHSO|nr:unnamed protein product [Schistocephalus solidus]